ncbi:MULTISPECIES: VOC family protein [unclassified Streptomyces]|uniref:VOC family protein n=1 Tax=unclassified Streptomyces TaxID=2593676 RepID=UPI0033F4620C
MEWTLEVIVIPVSDVDRARTFYADQCGFAVDHDTRIAKGVRILQLTPPGSTCSIVIGEGMPPAPGQTRMTPGAIQGLQLCVPDIEAAHDELLGRGVAVSAVQHVAPSGWAPGKGEAWNSFVFFTDPDGNGWVIQESPLPLSDRRQV